MTLREGAKRIRSLFACPRPLSSTQAQLRSFDLSRGAAIVLELSDEYYGAARRSPGRAR